MKLRWLKAYWSFRDALLPRNSRPRRLYEILLNSLRVLYTEGPGGVWWRIRDHWLGQADSISPEDSVKNPEIPVRSAESRPGWIAADRPSTASTGATDGPDASFVPFADTGFSAADGPVKLIAFYLPQFHPIPENDRWWGKGFTDWVNVSRAAPQFVGHYQPHVPGDLGFYDLRRPAVQRRQVELAKQYGVSGFCFHYYWFNGLRLLERPVEQFLSDPEIDLPFCLCWANENWTRRWDGRERDILIAQEHSEGSDLAFIRDLEPILRHRNYIRISGRPLLIVYRMQILPRPAATTRCWRDYCRAAGLGNPYLVAAQTFGCTDPREFDFDAAVEFPPHNCIVPDITRQVSLLNPDFAGRIHRYADAARTMANRTKPDYPLFKCVFPGWDNEPRRRGRGVVFAYSNPEEYESWLAGACRHALGDPLPEKRLVFINAWNEWAEGAYLEPDRKFGYAYLEATRNALLSIRS